MQEVCILERKAGHAIPADVLTPLLEKYKRYVSLAFVKDGIVQAIRLTANAKWQPSLETIQGNDVKFKDRKVFYCFGSITDDNINNADLQPYPLITNNRNEHQLLVFLDGKFAGFMTDGTPQHEQTKFVEKYLQPRVTKAFKVADNDLTKLMVDELSDQMMGQDMVSNITSDNGVIVFLSADDTDLKITVKGDTTHKEFEWGWLSNTSFLQAEASDPFQAAVDNALKAPAAKPADAPQPAPKQQPASPSGGLRRPGQAAVAKVAAPASPASGKPADSASGTAAPKTEPVAGEEDWVEIIVPKAIKDNVKSKGNFLRKRIPGEVLPNNWFEELNSFSIPLASATTNTLKDIKDGLPTARVFKKGTAKSLKDMGEQLKGGPAIKAAETKAASAVAAEAPKMGLRRPGAAATTTVEPKVQSIGERSKGIVEGAFLIPIAQRANMAEFLDTNSAKIKDPGEYREVEVPSFAKQLNHPLVKHITDTLHWRNDIKLAMIKANPDVALSCLNDWIKQAVKSEEECVKLRTTLAGKITDEDLDVTGTGGIVNPEPKKVVASGGLRRPGQAKVA